MVISAHVLNAVVGGPVGGVGVRLELLVDGRWTPVAQGRTDVGGRYGYDVPDRLTTGTYQWVFAAGEFFAAHGIASFHPEIPVVFAVNVPTENYHVPLLLSPCAYTTYRGY